MPKEQQETSVDDAVRTLLSGLPSVVKEFVLGPERDAIALQLTQKHGLHMDQGGAFQLAYIQMLLGAISPEEFSKNLLNAGISDEKVRALTNDVNEMVFKPLREKERLGFKEAAVSKGIRTSPSLSATVVAPAPLQPNKPPAPAPHYAPEPLAINTPKAAPSPSLPPLVPPRIPVAPPAPLPVAPTPQASEPRPYQKEVPPPANLPGIVAPSPTPPPAAASAPFPQPEQSASPAVQPSKPLYPSYSPRTAPPEVVSRSYSQHEPSAGEMRTFASDMLAVSQQREPMTVSYEPKAPIAPQQAARFAEPPPSAPIQPRTPVLTAQPQVKPVALSTPAPQRSEPVLPPTQPSEPHIAPVPASPAVQRGEPGAPRPRVSPTLNELVVKEYTQDPYREPIS